MALSRRSLVRPSKEGVSEVVGTLLILVMTVALFSVIILWVYGFPSPETEARVSLFPTLDRVDNTTANISIVHRGGETLRSSSTSVYLTVTNVNGSRAAYGPYNYSIGSGGESEWRVGGTWSQVFSPVPEDARVELRVVDTYREALILGTMLQRGRGVGGFAEPIVGVPVVLPDWEVVCTGSDTFYIRAIAVDYDNDLPDDGVVADLRPIWNGLGKVTLRHQGWGIFETPVITVPAVAIPGEYTVPVTAEDNMGHTDTNWALVKVVSPDKSPPVVIITHPTMGEISAGMARNIVATYTDPTGIDLSSVTMSVWEDNIALDTSSKTVTDTYVKFTPFGGFRQNSIYKVNVTAADRNGNVGYAETVFRMFSYAQPGNPRGETDFDVMDRNWISTTVFEHDDLIRVQMWSEVMPQVDDSELRLTKTDSSNIFIMMDRFAPNLSVPMFSESFPFYVYDATIDISSDGAYGHAIPPGYYGLRILAEYAAGNMIFDNQLLIIIKYPDGSMPNTGFFMTYNETGKWTSSTRFFDFDERVYIEVRTDHELEYGKTTINRAIVSISEVYGDHILYVEVPRSGVKYLGMVSSVHIYQFSISLTDTIAGSQWFCGANWYPLDVSIETVTSHLQPHPWKWWKGWVTYDIAFQAGDQLRITRGVDLAILPADVKIYHEDGNTTGQHPWVVFGEHLYINLTVWNLGLVDITNARVKVWAISDGVTLSFWDYQTDDLLFWDPNRNGMIDATAPDNYVQVDIFWNTSKTGYDQATLEKSKIRVQVDILTPVIAGYGSQPVPEVDYGNNEVERDLIQLSEGDLTVSDPGYATPPRVDIGQLNFLVDKYVLTASGGNVQLVSLTFKLEGTAQTSDVSQAYLFEDRNGNGVLDAGDRLAATGSFDMSGKFVASDSKVIVTGTSATFMLVYDIDALAIPGRTLGSRLATLSDVQVVSPAKVINTGFPFTSESSTIISNRNRLSGTAAGPANAFAGTYVRYDIALTAENIDPTKPGQGSATINTIVVHVTGAAYLDEVRLYDHMGGLITSKLAADTVTFSDIGYTVPASTGRMMYLVITVKMGAPVGQVVGFQIQAVDVTLSTPDDFVDVALNLQRTSTVKSMSSYFNWFAGDPLLTSSETVIYNMNIGVNTTDGQIYVAGLRVDWASVDMPNYIMRVYIDGELVFQDDGINHHGDDVPFTFINPIKLTTAAKSFRIEFDIQVTLLSGGAQKKWTENQFIFNWLFSDGSETHGGQKVVIEQAGINKYTISWQPI